MPLTTEQFETLLDYLESKCTMEDALAEYRRHLIEWFHNNPVELEISWARNKEDVYAETLDPFPPPM